VEVIISAYLSLALRAPPVVDVSHKLESLVGAHAVKQIVTLGYQQRRHNSHDQQCKY